MATTKADVHRDTERMRSDSLLRFFDVDVVNGYQLPLRTPLGKNPRGDAMSLSTGRTVVVSVLGNSPSEVNDRNVRRYIPHVDTVGAPNAILEYRCVILSLVLHCGLLPLEPRPTLGHEVHVIREQRSKRIHVMSVPASLPFLSHVPQRLRVLRSKTVAAVAAVSLARNAAETKQD
jgi:hypothetical protein